MVTPAAGPARRPRRPPAAPAVPRGGGERRGGEAGYNLVILTVIVTVMSVMLAAAMPAWSKMAQREKEEELIFRGLQYAEAIRVFQAKFGRYPTRLEELVEVEPRSIRRLWKDPLTDSNRWGLIFAQGAPGQLPPGQQNPGIPQGTGVGGRPAEGPPRAVSGDPNQVTTGPIVGVYSLAEGTPMKTFLGKESYEEWQFTVDVLFLVPMPGAAPGGPGGGGEDEDGRTRFQPNLQGNVGWGPEQPLPDLSARWIGRPWPPDLQIQMVPGQPGGRGPGPPAPPPAEGGGPQPAPPTP